MTNPILSVRKRLNTLFDEDAPPSRANRTFNVLLAALILVNVAAVVLESVEPIRDRYGLLFVRIEQVATAIFAVEYVLRVWTCVEYRSGKYRDPLGGRLRYMRSFFALVDLVAVLPAILGLLGAGDLRVLRLIRLLRMLKLTRHSPVFGLLWAVVREEARSIAAVLFILALTLVMSSAFMYMVEGPAQPELFNSIPASMWWAIETLTTIGYGDMVPITPWGKVLGGIVSVIGIGTLALYSGLITVSFMDQLRARRREYESAIEARLAAGKVDRGEIARIERFGEGLGLPEHEAIETAEARLAGAAPPARCPHCGQAIAAAGGAAS